VYTEPGISVDKSLTLQGAGATSTFVQAAATRGAAQDRVFTIARGVTVTLQHLTIRYGRAVDSGGGLYNQGTLTLSHCTVSGNRATHFGGGLFNAQGTLTLSRCTVSGNSAAGAGGLYNSGGGVEPFGTLTLLNSTVSGNSATSSNYGGGGIRNDGTLTLLNSTVSGNSAAYYSGGLVNLYTMTLINTTVSGNSATDLGGGLYNQAAMTLINSTVSGNSSTYAGGGLYNNSFSNGTLTLLNTTVSSNSAPDVGGLYNATGRVTLSNSIVADSLQEGSCGVRSGSPSIVSQGYNLDSDGSCQLTASTDLPGVDPRLGPLQNNGGPTFTHALLPGSPALDTIPWGANGCGTTLISDQRWRARPQPAGGACDIGAYEVEVAGQALGGWITGLTPHTVVCQDVTTGQVVTLSDPTLPWDCEAAGVAVSSRDQVALRVLGPIEAGATDVGGAVAGMTPSGGSCTNLTTGQQVPFQALFQGIPGATAASCGAAGLVIHSGDQVQMRVQGAAE
jgi:hypothetical protein